MDISSSQKLNKDFYNNVYKRRNNIINLVHTFISFDQQSKSKANYFLVKDLVKNKIENVLDFGFGHGSFLLKFPKNVLLLGVDISEEAVCSFPHKAKYLKKKALTATPDNIKSIIQPNSVDLVCLSHVLEHVDDDQELLNQVKDLVKPNGYLLINVPINEVWSDPKHVRAYDLDVVKKLLIDLDFEIIEVLMFDKLTAFFLEMDKNRKNNILKTMILRSMRLLLSFASFKMYRLLDRYIFKNYANQQLLVLAQKK